MDLTHPFSITLCQVIINGNDVNTLAFQCIQVCRKSRYQGLTFTGTHLSDTALMKDDTTHQLYTEMLHTKHSLTSFTYNRKSFRQEVIQGLTFCQTILEFLGFASQFSIRELLHLWTQGIDLVHDRIDSL